MLYSHYESNVLNQYGLCLPFYLALSVPEEQDSCTH